MNALNMCDVAKNDCVNDIVILVGTNVFDNVLILITVITKIVNNGISIDTF